MCGGRPAAAEAYPQWSALLGWAERWWYDDGVDDDAVPSTVPAFVADMAASI